MRMTTLIRGIRALLLVAATSLATVGTHAQETTPALSDPAKLVIAARSQVGVTLEYDPAYVSLDYPGGDVPLDRGVCTDVIIRAMREALGQDLQKLVHVDMKANFGKYPKNWGLKSTDKNIDHRRVPNLRVYFKRKGFEVPMSDKAEDFLPGDLVTCTVAGRLPHIMIVSDKRNDEGVPYIIHNIGAGAQEEDALFTYPHTGHYRLRESFTRP